MTSPTRRRHRDPESSLRLSAHTPHGSRLPTILRHFSRIIVSSYSAICTDLSWCGLLQSVILASVSHLGRLNCSTSCLGWRLKKTVSGGKSPPPHCAGGGTWWWKHVHRGCVNNVPKCIGCKCRQPAIVRPSLQLSVSRLGNRKILSWIRNDTDCCAPS